MWGWTSETRSEERRENRMNDQLLSLAADPRLIEIALCLGVIAILQWIELMK